MRAPESAIAQDGRLRVSGKFLARGHEKFYVRGVTYGPFRPNRHGSEYHDPATAARDLQAIAANGFNTIRTYTVPPRWLLDEASAQGLAVMVGVPWEQHVAFLDGGAAVRRSIVQRVGAGVRACAGHPAVLCAAIGNEIPASIVRWNGRRRIESFLADLYDVAKSEDPDRLVTYVNYPPTEYLDLPFLDFACFNVYLEDQERLAAYLARLQNLAGDRPLVLAEVGLDSERNGEVAQARSLGWQVRTAFATGCAGAVVFSWTDEWHRGGHDIDDWGFGLTTKDRVPKRALAAVRQALEEVPFSGALPWPRISVVVCSYNGARTLEECLSAVRELDYPDFEVIVIDDGSTDGTATIARHLGCRLVRTPNRGLSAARNTGLELATGEIVAYLDDDAYPDRHWLRYLASSFLGSSHVGVGGPNLPPPDAGEVARCVADSPGGPIHVLLSDTEAEHIPGCNMAFRRDALLAVGGFDPSFRIAGDDVDLCWRLQEQGWTLGFSPAAMVWHHRRSSVQAFWKQQLNYGRAEAMLERKWPERYNGVGHAIWHGRVYGPGGGFRPGFLSGSRIYHGVWGTGAFQPLQPGKAAALRSLLLSPDCYLLAAMVLATMAALWPRLFVVLPLLGISVGFTAVEAGLSASGTAGPAPRRPLSNRLLTVALHLLQPIARFVGRWTGSLTPLRRHGARRRAWPLPGVRIVWSERWHSEVEWLSALETHARAAGARIRRGGPHDRWDVEVRDGELGGMRVLLGIEEHGAGRQLLRFRLRPRVAPAAALVMSTATVLGGVSLTQQAWTAGAVLFGGLALLAIGTVRQWSAGAGATLDALDALHEDPATAPLEADEEWASDVEGEMGATLPHPDEAGNPVGVADGVLRPDPLGASPSRGQTSADPRVSL